MSLTIVTVAGVVLLAAVLPPWGKWSRWTRLDRFARANGLTFLPSAVPAYPGAIFGLGQGRLATDHLATATGRYLDLGNYRYSTGSGDDRTTHQWGFLALKLDRVLPHILLDAKANNGLFGTSTLPISFDRAQVLSLEGDFDRYFTLYCPKDYERDALYVFTPDLLALLIDESRHFDVEIVDDWMFVYSATRFDMTDPGTLRRLFRIVDTVGAKTLRQTARYSDERGVRRHRRARRPTVAAGAAGGGRSRCGGRGRCFRRERVRAAVDPVRLAQALGWSGARLVGIETGRELPRRDEGEPLGRPGHRDVQRGGTAGCRIDDGGGVDDDDGVELEALGILRAEHHDRAGQALGAAADVQRRVRGQRVDEVRHLVLPGDDGQGARRIHGAVRAHRVQDRLRAARRPDAAGRRAPRRSASRSPAPRSPG